MAATTPIPELPVPPVRADGRADFTAKADALMAALPPMVVNINSRLTWIWEQVGVINGYRQAAAQSADDAQGYASAASTSKNAAAQSATDATANGKAQVDLAKAQVTLANQARDSAQTAAAAAGSAAGLPSLIGNSSKVLRVNSAANGVEWALGLPDTALASVGQALVLGTGKAPKWDFVGQQIGDVLLTCRDPGALYLPANGSIRLQSAYPALFAKLGLTGGTIGTAWADYDYGGIATGNIAASSSGTIVAIQSATQIRRSADRGQTWSNITTPSLNSASDIKTDGSGTWIISSTLTASISFLRSVDDGLTWQLVTVPNASGAGGSWTKLTYCGNSVWIATSNYSTTLIRSVNGGANWSAITHGFPVGDIPTVAANGSGTVLIAAYDGSSNAVRKSVDYAATFSAFLTLTATANIIATDNQGTWIIGTGATNALRSFDDAATSAGFATLTVTGGSGGNRDILFINGYALFLFSTGNRVIIMNPNGSFSPQSSSATVSGKFAYSGNGIIFAGSTTANRLTRSLPQFGYDSSTQFALPNVQAAIGTSAYIKAKELT